MHLDAPWTLDPEGRYATEPAIALLPDGALALACAERPASGCEHITLRTLDPTPEATWRQRGPTLRLTAPGHASWPTLVTNPRDGALGLAFLTSSADPARREAALHLRYGDLTRDLLTFDAAELRYPALATTPDTLYVAWIARSAPAAPVALHALTVDLRTCAHAHHVVTTSDALLARPALAALGDGRAFVAWEHHGANHIRIDGALLDAAATPSAPTPLLTAPGFLQAPALAVDPRDGALWLATASDVPLGPPPALPRWLTLHRLDPTSPASPPQPVQHAPDLASDLARAGEDQSLEFPALAFLPDATLLLVGRASHNFRALRYTGEGWLPPTDLGDVLWGCRGVRTQALALPDRRCVVACHDRRGVTLHTLTPDPAPPLPHPCPHAAPAPTPPPPPPPPPLRPASRLTYTFDQISTLRAFFGDPHFHSASSDGVGTIEEAWLRARDRYGYDFACLTDHDAFLGRRITDATWRVMKDTAAAFHRPQEGFVALVGIEFTGPRYPGPGHKCVYLPDEDAPLVCRADGLDDPGALLARVHALGGFAIPHHVGWIGGDPEHHHPDLQPCWEICSAHGQYECPDDDLAPPPLGQRPCLDKDRDALASHYLRRQLEAGAIFGFMGGSDGHGLLWHHGLSWRADSHRTGLTGVWLEHLDRRPLLDAIRARRTFATTGEPIALAFTANGHPMGSLLRAPLDRLHLDIAFYGTAPGAQLHVFTPHQGRTHVALHATLDQPHATLTRTLDLPPEHHQRGFAYVRVTQPDRATAWASPVFWRHDPEPPP